MNVTIENDTDPVCETTTIPQPKGEQIDFCRML